jgi:hypothetical protein
MLLLWEGCFKQMRLYGKIPITIAAIAVMTMFSACGKQGDVSDLDTSSVAIQKDGSVVSTLIEDFSESYYDVDELKQMAQDEINAFTVTNGAGTVELESLDKKDGKVKMVIKFADAAAYSKFSDETLVYETVADAKLSGRIQTNLLVDAEGNVIDTDKADSLSGEHVVITTLKNTVAVPSKVKYVSRGVKLVDKYIADLSETEADSSICIVLSK